MKWIYTGVLSIKLHMWHPAYVYYKQYIFKGQGEGSDEPAGRVGRSEVAWCLLRSTVVDKMGLKTGLADDKLSSEARY